MAWVWKLRDGTSTVDLNDGTNTKINLNGFHAPPPPRITSMSGGGIMRHGQDLLQSRYGNRPISIDMQLVGSNATALAGTIQDIYALLRKAEEYNTDQIGTAVQLEYQWEGAAEPVYFNILHGDMDLGRNLHSQYLSQGTIIRNAQLSLVAEPFAVGTQTTLHNYVKDPGFEIAATELADWSKENGTGTILRTTADAYRGAACVELTRTAGTAFVRLSQAVFASATSGEVWSWSVRAKKVGGHADQRAQVNAEWFSTAGAFITQTTAFTTASGTWVHLVSTGQTAPADAGTVSIRFELNSGTGTGTVRFDNAYIDKVASLPVGWMSGRNVANHFDDDGQSHINYVDVHNIPGDVPALAKIKADENENHNEIWLAARHGERQRDGSIWIEAEDFTSHASYVKVVDSRASNGTDLVASAVFGTAIGAVVILAKDIPSPPQGIYRAMVRAGSFGTGTVYMGMGYKYGSVTQDPVSSSDYSTNTGTQWRWVDMGPIMIPPISTPQGALLGTFTLRHHAYVSATGNQFRIDAFVLLPVDQGMVYGTKAASADRVLVDSHSRLQAMYVTSTADVVLSVPDQQGSPPELEPRGSGGTAGSRIYILSAGGSASISNGQTVQVIYVPRYLHVA